MMLKHIIIFIVGFLVTLPLALRANEGTVAQANAIPVNLQDPPKSDDDHRPVPGLESLGLMRRWVVFPFAAEAHLKTTAEDAWFKTREKIISDKKYLVATRQFLIQKDVFQPRKNLSEDDAKLLAHLLDADVLVTGYNEQRSFTLNAYLGQDGKLFWSKKLGFHPSLKATDQLELINEKLTTDLLNQIPYQAFTIVDPLIGKPVFSEGAKKMVVVDAGVNEEINIGTDVQWVNVNFPQDAEGVLLPQMKINVIGQGRVTKIKRGVLTVELLGATTEGAIKERTLVRIPKVASKFEKMYASQPADVGQERLAPELVPTLLNPVAPESTGARKNTMVFGSILGVLSLLLFAF